MIKVGSIHGRFQPFHKGHARYFDEAFQRCEKLIVGITQYDIKNLGHTPEATHRSKASNNPLTYQQRCEIIEAYIIGKGIEKSRYSFSPFPIEAAHKIKDFIGLDVVCFTTGHAQWNLDKVKKLRDEGFQVEVLMQPDNSTTHDLSATKVRQLIRSGDENWMHYVPKACITALMASGGYESILKSSENNSDPPVKNINSIIEEIK